MNERMKNESFYKKLISLCIPFMCKGLTVSVVGILNSIVLGTISTELMSALTLALNVQTVLAIFVGSSSTGLGILTAQYMGKGDKESIERVFAIAFRISVAVAVFFLSAAALVPTAVMRILTNEEALIEAGAEYLRIVSPSYLFYGVSQTYLSKMKNSGKAVKVGIIGSVSVILNITLNAVLVYGLFGLPQLGIAGTAIATMISYGFECVAAVADSIPGGQLKLRIRYVFCFGRKTPEGIMMHELLRKFWKCASPVLGESASWGIVNTINNMVIGRMGTNVIAAHTMAMNVKNIFGIVHTGIAESTVIMVGHELGAGKFQRAKEYGSKLLKTSAAYSVVSCLTMAISYPIVVNIVELSAESREFLQYMLLMHAVIEPFNGFTNTMANGILPIGGDNRYSATLCACMMWGIVTPLVLLGFFVFHFPTMVTYSFFWCENPIRCFILYRRYRQYKWVKNLTE